MSGVLTGRSSSRSWIFVPSIETFPHLTNPASPANRTTCTNTSVHASRGGVWKSLMALRDPARAAGGAAGGSRSAHAGLLWGVHFRGRWHHSVGISRFFKVPATLMVTFAYVLPLRNNSSRFDGVWQRLYQRRLSPRNCPKLRKLGSRCVSSSDVTRVALIYTWAMP